MRNECQKIWANCLQFIQQHVNEQTFNTWFVPIIPKKFNHPVLTIQVPSQFFYEWLEEHHITLLRQVIHHEIGPEGKLEYAIIIDQGNHNQKPFTIHLPTQPNPNSAAKPPAEARQKAHWKSYLNPHYTFSSFIEGDCNQLAKSAAQAVAKKPGGTSFNPLLIYGRVGLGKTHLVQAIGNTVQAHFPDKLVVYVSSEQFTNQFIAELRNNTIQEFMHFYLQADLLILEDIQFLAGKEKTQEIFFHIFNHLHQVGKQIVITNDCSPRELKGLQERLLSRFKWGLTADLQRPDFETRVAIIQMKIEADGIDIEEELIRYIAYSVDTNIRELEGVLISLMAHASLKKREINLELAQQVLKNIVHAIDTEVNIDYLQKTVATYYSLPAENLKSKSRKKEIVIARQVAMYLAKNYTNHSLKSIGHYFGGRDHSTVIHAIQSVNDMLDTDPHVRRQVEEIKQRIK